MINNIAGTISFNEQQLLTKKLCNEIFTEIDGVIFIDKPINPKSIIRMNYYNRDGSFGAMCGNGARCIAMFAYKNSIVNDKLFILEAVNDLYFAEILDDINVKIKFPPPKEVIQNINLDLYINNLTKKLNLSYVNIGSDHAVIFIDENINKMFFGCKSLDKIHINEIGKTIRYHKQFYPRGVNVNFAAVGTDNLIQLRTYERGVERETLACGTGIISTGLIAMLKKGFNEPIEIKVQSGEILVVNGKYEGGEIQDLALIGSAVKISEGEIK